MTFPARRADLTDSFPRQQARTQRFTLGAPRNITVAPDGVPGRLPPRRRPRGRRSRRCGCWTSPPVTETVVADPSALLAGDPTDLPPGGAGAAGAGAGERGGHHRLRHRRLPPRGGGGPGRAAGGRRPRHRRRRDRPRAERRHRPPARPHGHPGGLGRRAAAVGGRARRPDVGPRAGRGRRPGGALGGGRVRGRRGDGPLPRVLVGAGRLGPPRDRGSTTRRSSAGGSRIRPIPTRQPTEVAYPAAGTPNAEVTAWILRLDGSRTEVAGIATTSPTWPRRRGTTTGRSSPCTPATSAASRCAAPTRAPVRPRRCGPTATRHGSSARPGTPARLADGRVVVCSDADGRRRLVVGWHARHPR